MPSLLASLLTLLAAACGAAAGPTYYVDPATGDDANAGRSAKAAWKTLAPANALTFTPGSRLLLRAGSEFAGPLNLRGSGAPGRPCTVGKYGPGPLPHIAVGPGGPPVVSLVNTAYWEVGDLELSGGIIGVYLWVKDTGLTRHHHFRRLDIHDILGSTTGDDGGFLLKREGEDTWFDDLLVEGCTIRHADRNGILLTDYPTASDKHHSTRVVLRGNHLQDIGGDGIFILGCDGAVIEDNVVRYAHQRVGRRPGERACAGIWPHRCNDTLIQRNEVSHTAVGGLTVWDSEGFDDDCSCRRTIFQYNYSHDNAGGFLLICGGPRGTIARYNVSQNDGVATFTAESDGTGDALVHNNTIYVGPELSVVLIRNTFGKPDGIRFANNIIYAAGTVVHSPGGITGLSFDHNAFLGRHENRPADPNAIVADPLLAAPGTGAEGFASLAGYRLRPLSPCRAAGVAIPGSPRRDFWGHRPPAGLPPSIGANSGG
jgi:hypothetical protein